MPPSPKINSSHLSCRPFRHCPPPDGVVFWAGVGVFLGDFAGGGTDTVAIGFRFRGVLCLRDCCLDRCCECCPLTPEGRTPDKRCGLSRCLLLRRCRRPHVSFLLDTLMDLFVHLPEHLVREEGLFRYIFRVA